MKKAIVYTVCQREVLVGDHTEMYNMLGDINRAVYQVKDEKSAIVQVGSVEVPLHHVKRCVRPQLNPLDYRKKEDKYEDFFIAIDPHLEGILNQFLRKEYEKRLDAYERGRLMVIEDNKRLSDKVEDLMSSIKVLKQSLERVGSTTGTRLPMFIKSIITFFKK